MKIASRFTIAIHSMLCIAYYSSKYKVTSSFIASSVNVNPVVIRRILGQLKEAGLIHIEPGIGGSSLAKSTESISLLDIFQAVDCIGDTLFNFHTNPCQECVVGKNIHTILDGILYELTTSFETHLSQITLSSLEKKLSAYSFHIASPNDDLMSN